MTNPQARSVGASAAALLASSATLVCCVLPAVMVSLGAGAALVGLVAVFPQLVWLSEHKALIFSVAAGMLLLAGAILFWARHLPCPSDPAGARQCVRLRSISLWLYAIASSIFAIGAIFAFVLSSNA